MNMKRLAILSAIVLSFAFFGCTPRIRVISNPKPHDKGIRYYRPKPYLLVTSSGETKVTVTEDAKQTVTVPDAKYVNIQLQYLPDFEEEYAIDVRSGFGVADVAITLDQGWNLTSINQKLDSQTDENLQGAAALIGSIAKVAGGTSGSGVDANKSTQPPSFNVVATNVPLGYYESVIGKDQCGRKRLYGFRYLGFMPYQSCPVQASGAQSVGCNTEELYGIVFHNGVMTFKLLSEIAATTLQSAQLQSENSDLEIKRTLIYDGIGKPDTVKIQLDDKVPVSVNSDGNFRIGIPELTK
jgi:hypothetical protein